MKHAQHPTLVGQVHDMHQAITAGDESGRYELLDSSHVVDHHLGWKYHLGVPHKITSVDDETVYLTGEGQMLQEEIQALDALRKDLCMAQRAKMFDMVEDVKNGKVVDPQPIEQPQPEEYPSVSRAANVPLVP